MEETRREGKVRRWRKREMEEGRERKERVDRERERKGGQRGEEKADIRPFFKLYMLLHFFHRRIHVEKKSRKKR